jgi:hypothetical protein
VWGRRNSLSGGGPAGWDHSEAAYFLSDRM